MRRFVLPICLCLVVLQFEFGRSHDIEPTLSLSEFRQCVQECVDQYGRCLKPYEHLWHDYFKNLKRIRAFVTKCCMKNADKEKALATDSFAACTKINCGAQLYGCNIRRTHSGVTSKEEKQHGQER